MSKTTGIKTNIHDEPIKGHRYGKKLTNNDYGTVAFLINKGDILENKKANANSFIDPELRFNCIYFLIGHEYDNDGNTIEKMYVGQAGIRDNQQSVLDRLNEHAWLGNDPAKYIDKWTDIVVVTNEKGAWGATELDALEHIFWSLIPVGNRLNSQKPTCTGADLESFTNAVSQIKEYLDYLEFTTFKEKTTQNIVADVKEVADSKSDIPIDLDNGTSRIPNITTPIKVINQMLDLLPDEVWNDKTVFLDPACKDGGYLKAIHDRLVKRPELIQKYGSERALSIHILSEQIYGIALNQNSRAVTIDKLDGFGYNIRVIPNYIEILKYIGDIQKKKKDIDIKKLIQGIINKEFNKDMEFNVVIGNPPYQETTTGGKNGGKVLYDKFIEFSMNISNIICLITKDNWLNSEQLSDLRQNILHFGLYKVIDYPVLGEVFPSMGISTSIIVCHKSFNESTKIIKIVKGNIVDDFEIQLSNISYIPTSRIEACIISKISSKNNNYSFRDNVIISPFGINTNGSIGDEIIDYSELQDDYYNTSLVWVDHINYINKDDIPKNKGLLDKYKVICPKQIHKTNNPIPKVGIVGPNAVCTASYSIMYSSNEKSVADNVCKYIKTRLYRFLVYCLADSLCGLTGYRTSLVPLQNFNDNSDIDWSQPLFDIDNQLYKKYGLSLEEISYIEQTIKPMEETIGQPKVKVTNEDLQANYINQMINNQ